MRDDRILTTATTKSLAFKRTENQQKQTPDQTVIQPAGMPGYMLRLQRQYGNRFVQRVVDLFHPSEGEANVAPDAQWQIKSEKEKEEPIRLRPQRIMTSVNQDIPQLQFRYRLPARPWSSLRSPSGRWGVREGQRRPPRPPRPDDLPGSWRWARNRGEEIERKQREVQKEVAAWARGERPTKVGLILNLLSELLDWSSKLQSSQISLMKRADAVAKTMTWPAAIQELNYLKQMATSSVANALRWLRMIPNVDRTVRRGIWSAENKLILQTSIAAARNAERRLLDLEIFVEGWKPRPLYEHPKIFQG